MDSFHVTKACSTCTEIKELTEFPPDKRNRDGVSSLCRRCAYEASQRWVEKSPEKKHAGNQRYYESHHDAIREQQVWDRLLARYGLTQEQYDELFEKQDGKCAICRQACKTGQRLAVDHDHDTLEVRGLLCRSCNMKLGVLENETWRLAAESYLEARWIRQM